MCTRLSLGHGQVQQPLPAVLPALRRAPHPLPRPDTPHTVRPPRRQPPRATAVKLVVAGAAQARVAVVAVHRRRRRKAVAALGGRPAQRVHYPPRRRVRLPA